MANGKAPFLLGKASGKGFVQPAMKDIHGGLWRAWATAFFWFLVALFLLAPFHYLHRYTTRLGEPAPDEILAPFSFSVVDRQATDAALGRIIETTPHIWLRNENLESRALQRLQSFINLLREENPQNSDRLREFTRKLAEQLDIALDETTANQFQESRLRSLRPPLTLSDLRTSLDQIIRNVMSDRMIVADKVAFQAHLGKGMLRVINSSGTPAPTPDPAKVLWWPQEVREYLQTVELPRYFPEPEYAGLRQASAELLRHLLEPNLIYDNERFQRDYDEDYRRQQANPVYRTYAQDDLIVNKGAPLSQLQADALDQINAIRRNKLAIKMTGIALITAISFAAVAFYLKRFRRDVVLDASTVTLYALPPLLALAVGQVLMALGFSESVIMIWFPAAMVGMLSALLMTPQVAFVLVLVSSCLFGIVTDQKLGFMVFALFGGFSAVFISRWVRARGEVLLLGLQVSLVNVVTLIILGLLKDMSMPPTLSLFSAALSGLMSAFGTLVFLVIFERAFGIVTDLRLLELTGLKHPLIAQFEEKAPGSYQHVLNVTKLAEAAAQAIGANYLLVRAGAYFHDIGKMVKPKYFSENQVTLDDKKGHAKLSPYMSVLIIKNHVKEGVELGKRFGLPQKIVDFIPQHHGTGLIRYFYSEALKRYAESGAVDEPREEDFRYPGPKPQSIETAIVLIADSVEAIAASKFTGGQVSEGELRRMVQTAISEKFDDGQFDECDLTLRHLHKIREALVKTLMARYHFRVAYPTMPKREPPRESRELAESPIAIAGPVSSGS